MRKGGALYYLHADHLGSTVMTTQGQAIDSTQQYAAFGSPRSSSGTLPTDHTYTGQKRDGTGLMYYRARYYDPSLGQFISPDTIVPDPSSVLSYNRYLYTRGNPLNRVDPTGNIDQGPYINPGSNCWRWCGGAPSMNPRRPSPEAVQESQLRQQQAEAATGYLIGALEGAPYIDTPNDVTVAITGCGYRCRAGYEEPTGFWGRTGGVVAVVLPVSQRFLSVATEFGINSYKALGDSLGKGSGLQRHHIVEKRFANTLGVDDTNDMLSVAVTKEDHQLFTNAWRKAIGYVNDNNAVNTATATQEQIWSAAKDIYANYSDLLDAAKKTIFDE